jgi:hypothetical protein
MVARPMFGLGCIMGLVLGIIPGIGGLTGTAMLLPFTFTWIPTRRSRGCRPWRDDRDRRSQPAIPFGVLGCLSAHCARRLPWRSEARPGARSAPPYVVADGRVFGALLRRSAFRFCAR